MLSPGWYSYGNGMEVAIAQAGSFSTPSITIAEWVSVTWKVGVGGRPANAVSERREMTDDTPAVTGHLEHRRRPPGGAIQR